MKLHEWYIEQDNARTSFWEYWSKCHQQNPQQFPLDLLSGDWDEQFGLFRTQWAEAQEKFYPQEKEGTVMDNIISFPYKISLECPDCRGSGLVTAFAGRVQGKHKCPKCDGQGKLGAK